MNIISKRQRLLNPDWKLILVGATPTPVPLCATLPRDTFVSQRHFCWETTVESVEHEIRWRRRADQCVGIKEGWGRIGPVNPVCHSSVDYSPRSGAWAEWWSLIILCALLMSGSQRSSSLWKPSGARQRARGEGVNLGTHSDFWFSFVTLVILCSSSVELRRIQADPAGGLSLREDLQCQRPGLQG